MRYHEGEWQTLTTEIVNEDSLFVYYQAEAFGTSTFAITGETAGATQPFTIYYAIIGAVIAVLVTLSLLYYKRRS